MMDAMPSNCKGNTKYFSPAEVVQNKCLSPEPRVLKACQNCTEPARPVTGHWEPAGRSMGPINIRKFSLNYDINLSSPSHLHFSLTICLNCPPTGILIFELSWQQRALQQVSFSGILCLSALHGCCTRAEPDLWLPAVGS